MGSLAAESSPHWRRGCGTWFKQICKNEKSLERFKNTIKLGPLLNVRVESVSYTLFK